MADTYENPVTVACVNLKPAGEDKAATLKSIKEYTVQASREGANIILFPELALTAVPPEELVPEFAETIPGPSTEEMAKIAAQHNVYVIFGMLERDKKHPSIVYNAAAVIAPTGILGAYRKTHPFLPFETNERGREYPIFETRYGPIGIGICYDTYCFPEVCRNYAIRGVRLYLNPTGIFYGLECGDDVAELYMTILGARSIENQMFLASANVVGKVDIPEIGGEITMFGKSVILGPKPGYSSYQIFAGPASDTEEEIVIATLDLSVVSGSPLLTNILKHRYPETYTALVAPG